MSHKSRGGAWLLLAVGAGALACARAAVDADVPGGGNDVTAGRGGRGAGGAGANNAGGGLGNFTDALASLPEGEECNQLQVRFTPQTPTVLLLVDRSTSMTDERYGTDTRWAVLKQAVLDPQNGLVRAVEADVRLGLATYTSTAQSASCPEWTEVGIRLNNFNDIQAHYGPLNTPSIKGETPTGEAIARATALLEAVTEEGPKFIVLATDGEPDTCPGTCTGNCPISDRPGYPRDPNCGHDRSVAAVQAAYRKGIRTFVIAIGGFERIGVDHLQAVANAGQGLPAVLGAQANWLQYSCNIQPAQLTATWSPSAERNAPVYRPESPADLARDLRNVLNQTRSCVFKLQGNIVAGNEPFGIVYLDDERLAYQDPNGYRVTAPDEVEILGSACMRIQENARGLRIGFPCGSYIPAD